MTKPYTGGCACGAIRYSIANLRTFPCVSILAAATLQPVLLSFYGRRGTVRKRFLRNQVRRKLIMEVADQHAG